ncbi:MAG: hypothetical protein AB2L07_21930 [Thermoanaerobaculaceae bacterium]
MRGFEKVSSQAAMETLLDKAGGFHDSLARDLRLSNRGWVDTNARMAMSTGYDLQIVLQSQLGPRTFELVFVGVRSLSCSGHDWFSDASGVVSNSGIHMSFRPGLEVDADALFYRVHEGWLGPDQRLYGEVPSHEAIPAVVISEGWRQCSGCADAWQEPSDSEFARCPACRRITQLEAGSPGA